MTVLFMQQHQTSTCAMMALTAAYLPGDNAHDHGFGGAHKHMVQAHGPKQAVGSGQAGVGVHQEGGALHEGSQVNVHVTLLICQIPVQDNTTGVVTD